MRIEQVVQQDVSKVKQSSGGVGRSQQGTGGEARTTDKVELSKSAELLRTANAGLDRTPEVRPEKIAQAMTKIQEGFYNRPEVREQIAVVLAGSPALTGDITEARQVRGARAQMKATSETRADRTAETKKRVAEGFYDTVEVRDAIADRVVEAVVGEQASSE